MFRNLVLLLCVASLSACTITYGIRRDWSDDAARREAARDFASAKLKVLCAGNGIPLGLDMTQQKLVKKLPKQWFYRDNNDDYPFRDEAHRYAIVFNLEICRLLSSTNAPSP